MYRVGRSELHVNTFFGDGELSALGNLDSLGGLVAWRLVDVLDLLNDVVALENLTEDDMAAVKPSARQETRISCRDRPSPPFLKRELCKRHNDAGSRSS